MARLFKHLSDDNQLLIREYASDKIGVHPSAALMKTLDFQVKLEDAPWRYACTEVYAAEMDYFNSKMAAHCKDSVRASDFAFAAIDGLPKNVIATLLNELSKGKEFALSFATTEGTRAGKERAVRYWRVFCALLRIPEVVSSFSNDQRTSLCFVQSSPMHSSFRSKWENE